MPFGWAAAATVVGAAVQADSSRRASNTQRDAAREGSDQQWRMYEQNRADAQPWQQAGRYALSQLTGDVGGGYGGGQQPQGTMYAGGTPGFYGGGQGGMDMSDDLTRPFGASDLAGDAGYQDAARDFSLADFQSDPGYQFRLNQGREAIENSAAARGGLMGGNTGRALMEYGQNFASNEFQNAFGRFQENRRTRSGAYQDAFSRNSSERGNRYNIFNNERNTRYNQLANLAGLGQTANTQVGNWGANAANQSGMYGMQGANAQAAGQMGRSNAWVGAANNLGNMAMQRWGSGGGSASMPAAFSSSSGDSGVYQPAGMDPYSGGTY